ncbi:MAG: DUF1853 family protein [Verrucomicrobiota bacterium]
MNKAERPENSPWLRDLQWVINSPFLMNSGGGGGEELPVFGHGMERELKRQEAEVLLGQYAGRRVGYYFESLVHYWLKAMRKVEILAQGHQIVENGRTLGELDFVFRDEQGVLTHWEVAVKFYLYCSEIEVKGSHYIGPNAGDTFELKRDKVFARQLPLSEKLFPELEVRQAFVKGRIFYHPQTVVADERPLGLMAGHLRGTWIRSSELSWLESGAEAGKAAYHLIEKPHWLADFCESNYENSLLDFQTIKEHLQTHFSQQKQPVLISVLTQRDDSWQECERVFVVADDWPAIRSEN